MPRDGGVRNPLGILTPRWLTEPNLSVSTPTLMNAERFSCKPRRPMAPKYELLPSSPVSSRPTSPSSLPPYDADHDASEYHPFDHCNDVEEEAPRRPTATRRRDPIPALDSDPRFRARTPSPYARAALLFFICFLFWLAFALRKAMWVAGGMGMPTNVPEVDASY